MEGCGRRLSWTTGVLVRLSVAGAWAASASIAGAQGTPSDDFWTRWFRRSDQAKADEPHWIAPLVTSTPRIEQEFRYDITWQQAKPGGPIIENFGNAKGIEVIPSERLQVVAGLPPYIVHHNPNVADGFGDFQMSIKYRVVAAPPERGDYILSASLASSFPTGSGTNGQPNTVLTPSLIYGKGIGEFDIQGAVAAVLPTGNATSIGQTLSWNNTFQEHLFTKLWPEVEVNTTWFHDGRYDGKHQVFLLPGIIFGRSPLTPRVGLTIGAGLQIAVSQFHTSNHTLIVSTRLPF